MSRIHTSAVGAAAALLALAPGAPAQSPNPELPIGELSGVRVERTARDGVVVTFTPRAARLYRRIAGRRVVVTCARVVPRRLRGRDSGRSRVTLRAPRTRRPLRTGRRFPGADHCRVSRAGKENEPVAGVPLTRDGAVFVDEQLTVVGLLYVLEEAAGDDQTFPAPQAFVAGAGKDLNVVALAAPTDTPPAGKRGYYSDGARHAIAVELSSTGRRLYVEHDGDRSSTNVVDVLSA